MGKIGKHASLTPELAEALVRMDKAYEEAASRLPSVEWDWEYVLLGVQMDVIIQAQQAMKAEGLTRAELARKLDVSRAYVSKMLNETKNFKMETIAKLAVALERDIALRFIRKNERIVVEPARIKLKAAQCWESFNKQPSLPSFARENYDEEPATRPGDLPAARILDVNEEKAA